MSTDRFFAFARERHAIHLRRIGGLPRSQWTSDPILQQYRFTNVFRELDRATVWFREHVRDPLRDSPEVLLATVLFRWFNRITTGEAIFLQKVLFGGRTGDNAQEYQTPWGHLLAGGTVSGIADAVQVYCGDGPYVTGAYIIKTPDGKSKLDGVLWCIEQFMERRFPVPSAGSGSLSLAWRGAATLMNHARQWTLEDAWSWLRQFPYMGDFMAYEVVTDLRHTSLLDKAPDIMTWANPGPGAMRGLNRIHDRDLGKRGQRANFIQEMQWILSASRDPANWPQHTSDGKLTTDGYSLGSHGWSAGPWPVWEMRDVEHTLCEFDKYERVRLGEGRPRGVYR